MGEPYRDELEAALRRVDALETDLREALTRQGWRDVQIEAHVHAGAVGWHRLWRQMRSLSGLVVFAVITGLVAGTAVLGGMAIFGVPAAEEGGERERPGRRRSVHSEPPGTNLLPGPVYVNSDPQGARIYLDGADTGRFTPEMIPMGNEPPHPVVRVELDGYEPQSKQLTARAPRIFFRLEALSPPPEPVARDLDQLLAEALSAPARPDDAHPDEGVPGEARPDDDGLPASLTRSQVQAGMRRIAGAVRRCAPGETGQVTVSVVIHGATGRVTSATITRRFAGTPIGSCVARAARGARFSRFRDESMTIRHYPFALR